MLKTGIQYEPVLSITTVRNTLRYEPFAQTDQRCHSSIETQSLTARLFLSRTCQHTADKKTFADVNSGTAFDDLTHCLLLVADELTRRT